MQTLDWLVGIAAKHIDAKDVIAAVVAAALIAFAAWVWRLRKNRPHVRRIKRDTDKDWDKDWDEVCALHERLFDTQVADNCENIRGWIEQNWRERKEGKKNLEELLLVAKSNDRVIGYFYGQLYYEEKYLFISYLGSRPKQATLVSPLIVKELFRILNARKFSWKKFRWEKINWKAAIAELEEIKHVKDKDFGAYRLLKIFGFHVEKISKENKVSAEAFRLCLDYRQPLLRPKDIANKEELSKDKSLKQWLLYVPLSNRGLITEGENLYITKNAAIDVMKFILDQLYSDAFPDHKDYVDYLLEELKRYENTLPEKVRVIHDADKAATFHI